MARQCVLEMEEGQIQCEMPALRPFDIAEYCRIVQRHAPSASIVDIPKFSGEIKDSIMEWLELWNRAVMANGWSIDDEVVMFPLCLFGRALLYFRTLPTVKGDVYQIKRGFEKRFNSPFQRLQAKHPCQI